MQPIETHPIWMERQNAFLQLNTYLQTSLAALQFTGAVAYGSVMRLENTYSKFSDIDIVAYSDLFSRESAQNWIDLVAANSPDFFDKAPIYIEDHVTARIEFSIQLGGTVFDVSIFPSELSGYRNRYTNTLHDRLEVVIGSMYENGYLLFGAIPFEPLLQKEFLPFYGDDLRTARMQQLEARLQLSLRKLELAVKKGEDDLLCQIYKSRSYLIKWMFIHAKKYPVDCNRYLNRQLSQILQIPEATIDALLLNSGSLDLAYCRFLQSARNILSAQTRDDKRGTE